MSADHSATMVPRLVGGTSVIIGVTLLAAPARVADSVFVNAAVPTGVVRLLGARYLAQGVAQLGWPRPGVLEGAAVVDGLHALSMVALAAGRPRYRRAAWLSASFAAAGTAANAVTAHRVRRTRR